jgi:aminoglycoside phosphotransferase (APT) family kinase protein
MIVELATAIATVFFTQPPDSLSQIEGLGSVNRVFVAQCSDKKIVVRLPQTQDRDRAGAFYAKEAWCLEQAARLKIPGPTVLASGEFDGWPYQIQSFLDGVNGMQSAPDSETIWQVLGKYARRFHDVALDGFGETLPDFFSGNSVARWHGWIDYNVQSLTPSDRLIELGVYSPRQRAPIEACFLALREQTNLRIGLCHGDLGRHNTLITSTGDIALLDWGCAEAHVVPHFDLLHLPSEQHHAFLDGYGVGLSEREGLLAEVEQLRVLKAFDLVRWAIDRCPERISELAQKAAQSVSVARSK